MVYLGIYLIGSAITAILFKIVLREEEADENSIVSIAAEGNPLALEFAIFTVGLCWPGLLISFVGLMFFKALFSLFSND